MLDVIQRACFMNEEPNEEAAATEPSRRSFLNKLWIGLGLVALAEVVAVVFTFLRSNKSKAREADSNAMVHGRGRQ